MNNSSPNPRKSPPSTGTARMARSRERRRNRLRCIAIELRESEVDALIRRGRLLAGDRAKPRPPYGKRCTVSSINIWSDNPAPRCLVTRNTSEVADRNLFQEYHTLSEREIGFSCSLRRPLAGTCHRLAFRPFTSRNCVSKRPLDGDSDRLLCARSGLCRTPRPTSHIRPFIAFPARPGTEGMRHDRTLEKLRTLSSTRRAIFASNNSPGIADVGANRERGHSSVLLL